MSRTMKSIVAQTQAQKAQVQRQRQKQSQQVEEEARRVKEQVRKKASKIVKSAETALQDIRSQEAKEKKRQPLTHKRPVKRKSQLQEVEKQKAEALAETKQAKKDIEKTEKEILSKIEQAASQAEAEVEKASQEAIKQYNELKKDNVELSTGEWIDKDAFNELDSKDQKSLKKLGIDAYNDKKEAEFKAEFKAFKKAHVEIKGGWIDKEEYDKLSKADKIYIKEYGAEKYNKYATDRDFKTLSTGELINKAAYNELDKTQQALLNKLGVKGYNQRQEDVRNKQLDDLYEQTLKLETMVYGKPKSTNRSDWDKLSDSGKLSRLDNFLDKVYMKVGAKDELVERDFIKSLSPDEQTVLIKKGVDALEKYQDKKYITTQFGETLEREALHSLPFDAQVMIDKKGIKAYDTYIDKNYQQIKTGELVDKTFYNNLVPNQQAELNKLGYTDYVKKNYKTLSNGDIVPKKSYRDITGTDITGFDDMSKVDQQDLMRLGVTDFNKLRADQLKKELKKYHELDNGELILKDNYKTLEPDDQKLLDRVGITQFNIIQEQEYQDWFKKQTPETQKYIDTFGIGNFNLMLEKADNETDEKAFVITQQLGIIPGNAIFVSRNDKGEFKYREQPDVSPIQLDSIDYDSLTNSDYSRIVEALDKAGKIKALPGVVGASPAFQVKSAFENFANQQTPENKRKLLDLQKQAISEGFIDAAALVFPPVQALKPDVELKDISGVDWAIGAANVALIALVPTLGALGKLASGAGKLATTGKIVSATGQTIKLSAVAAYPVITAIEWKKMTPTQQKIAVALNIAIVGAVYGKVIVSGLKKVLTWYEGKLSTVDSLISDMAKAVKKGSVAKIKSIATKIEKLAVKEAKSYPLESELLRKQARFIRNNASEIANSGVKMSDDIANSLSRINKSVGSPSIGKFPAGVFKKADVKPSPAKLPTRVKVKEIPAKTKKQADKFLKMRTQQWVESKAGLSQAQKLGLAQKVQRKTPAAPKTLTPGAAETAASNLLTKAAKEAGVKAAIHGIIEKRLGKLTSDATGFVKIPKPNLKPAQWKPTLITELSKADIKALIAQWAKMSPSKALQQMLEANMITLAMATNARAIIKILNKADAKLQAKIKSVVSPKLREAIEQATRTDVSSQTKTRSLAKVSTIAKADIKTATKAITKLQTKVEALTKTETLTQAQTKTQAAAKTEAITKAVTKAITDTTTKTTTKAQVETQVQQAVAQQIQQITNPAVKKAVKANKATIVNTIATRIARGTKASRMLPPPIIELPDGKKRPMTKEEMKGAVAWKQGFIYKMIYPPYDNMQNSRKPYPGIKTVKGARSAYESIIKLKDRIPAKLAFDMGIMDIFIETPRGGKGKPKLRFERDVKQKTKHTGLSVAK